MSQELLETLTKITNDNIKDFYDHTTIFFVVSKGIILGHFNTMPRFINNNVYALLFYQNNEVTKFLRSFKTTESEDSYNERVADTKAHIKTLIKEGTLYGKTIK